MQDAVGFSIELELPLALAWDQWQLRQAGVAVGGPSAVVRTMAKREENAQMYYMHAYIHICIYAHVCLNPHACSVCT